MSENQSNPQSLQTQNTENENNVEQAKVRQPRRISPFWLLPITAFIIGGLLFFQILKERGETITIHFKDGAGITAGKTPIKYQGLDIGQVKVVKFAEDLKTVDVTAEINAEAESLLREDTIFWLVQPSVSLAGVSGLDSIVSGNYITLYPGDSEEEADEFNASDDQPAVPVTNDALFVKLTADNLGSISTGASVYFKKVPVGSVLSYNFTEDHQQVEINLMIDKKYADLVKQNSRFWNISGIKADVDLSGVSVSMDSLQSVVQGAIAFDSPKDGVKAEQDQHYKLYDDLKAAKRGIALEVSLPMTNEIKVNETNVYYQGMKVGSLSELNYATAQAEDAGESRKRLNGQLLIDPNYENLLHVGTQIVLKEPKFAFNKEQLSKLGELVRGNFLEIVKVGTGEKTNKFTVQRETDYLLSRPNILAIMLTAPRSYGVDKGQGIYYNDVQIGEILERKLNLDKVAFRAMIYPPYRHLIGANSKFVSIAHFDMSASLDGVNFKAASPVEWLKGGIRVLVNKPEGKVKKVYPLYEDTESARTGIVNTKKTTTVTLSADKLSGIDKGSVVLYRGFEVGEVLKVVPKNSSFDVSLYIKPKYQNLIGSKNRFWIESAVAVDVSTKGVKVNASPLMRTLKGAISFDNNGAKQSKKLYVSKEKMTSSHSYITLTAKDASKLSEGMPVKYMGLTVGKVESLKLENAKKRVKVTASIDSKYYGIVARSGSSFKAIAPEVDPSGFKNLDAVIQNYINVDAGTGKRATVFRLKETGTVKTEYHGGFPIIVETSDANGITPNAPVLFRGMQVGIVDRLTLNELHDRVFIHLRIKNQYSNLVRKNTKFWANSGYKMDVGLNGATLSSGTFAQFLNGGVSFSTPSGKVVQRKAKPNQHFLLQRKVPKGAEEWSQGIF